MTARLIQRASRLLAVPASFQPPSSSSSAVPTECMRLCQHAPPPRCRAALHTSSPRYLAESLPETSQMGPVTPQDENEFFSMLKTVPGINNLLDIPREQNVSGNKGVMIIQEIVRREPGSNEEILKDPRFQHLLDHINGQIQHVWNGRLIKFLRSLYVLGLDRNHRCFQSVEVEVQWRLRKFSIGALAQLSSFIAPLYRSRREKALLEDLVKQVELRWTEIRDTRSLVTLISRLGFMSNSLMERLEDKVLEFAGDLKPEESRKVISALSAENRRTVSVLRAISFHLIQFKGELSPSVILDLAFAFAKLNFCQPQVLQKMATDIMPKLQEISPTDIASLVRSIAYLKYSNQPLCEAIAQACLQCNQSFSPSHLCTVLLGFAHLNFIPGQSEEFFNMIHLRLGCELESLSWQMQLDVVWSLCILNHVTVPYFHKILKPQVYSQILAVSEERSAIHSVKLMHINATAQLESPDYRGPLLPEDVLQTLQSRTGPRRVSALQNAVIETLKKVFPDEGTCNYSVPTVYGWSLDGEVVLDSDLKALALKHFEDPHDSQSGGTQPLPEGARRFAIVCREFSHYTFREKVVLGRYAMNQRHLRAAGFLVVEVPYYDWQELKSDWEKQGFLKDQIKKVMAKDMAE
ncbi:FAST kinase domain-containing protein 4-like [Rana temporaria]|uniref:FAST kinase domain-containing protein 4-like n=1 Tax=Rana temporaria TaxID=8407 RepID=UPI001AADC6A7|nr:FAST kinase domain-containing protein 4-like [Rana temporaria]XP_040211159.1 FAST kinase domain-containing protein 4-like [Rana temporaria]XP_040211160.1 FAST kinase domain-containing protein 4-like [Rana temporaria]XP_040211162.1 FAST kinase domain-containing protein 4-like [Rana temporaria]